MADMATRSFITTKKRKKLIVKDKTDCVTTKGTKITKKGKMFRVKRWKGCFEPL